MNAKNHIDSLDILRGLAIFMVVWGHLIDNNNILYRYLNNLHLPLFFVISGFLLASSLSRHTCEYVLTSKFFHLFIPFLSWSMVDVILKITISIMCDSFSLNTVCMILSEVFIYANSAWFLWILFLGCCLIILYERINKNKYLFWIFIFCIYLFLPNDILKLGKLKIMFPIFFLGIWVYKNHSEKWMKNIFFKIAGFICSIFFLVSLYFIYDKDTFINFTEFQIPVFSKDALWYLYFWSIQFSGLFFSICVLHPILKKFHLKKMFKIAGIYSLDIYMQHLFLVNYIINISTRNIYLKQLSIIIYTISITAFCIFISKYILHKIRLYRIFMIGKEYIHVKEQ